MPSLPRQTAVTLTFYLRNLIRSSIGAIEYSLSVSAALPKPFIRHIVVIVIRSVRTNKRGGRTDRKQGPDLQRTRVYNYSLKVLKNKDKNQTYKDD